MSTDRKEKLLELFNQRAPIAKTFGMKLSFDVDDRANISLPYNPALDHALGGIHGGIIATLLDNAGWFTCALAHEGEGWVVTAEMSLHLFQPVQKTDLLARGRILKAGKRQDIADMRCWDTDNNLVAHATGTFLYLEKMSIREPPKP
jgi:uncharacterized protein (TIGR00369 family)